MWSYQRVPAGEGMKGDIELVWQQEGVCVCERERQSSGKSCGKCECVCARAPLWARMRFIQRDFCLEAGWWSKCRCEDGRYRTWKWRPALVVHCNSPPLPVSQRHIILLLFPTLPFFGCLAFVCRATACFLIQRPSPKHRHAGDTQYRDREQGPSALVRECQSDWANRALREI